MKKRRGKVLLAAGGTGGHLFPAQAIAKEIQKRGVDVLFSASNLSTNRCFKKQEFAFQEICSATLRKNHRKGLVKASWMLIKGFFQSLSLLHNFAPDVVIGFGSFYSLPLLAAAVVRRVPIILFESNSIPGRVNRFFSRWAKFAGIQFPHTRKHLKCSTYEINVPLWQRGKKEVTQSEARAYFCLDQKKETVLVFGGSQGASSINELFCEAITYLKKRHHTLQVVHITGNKGATEKARRLYARLGIPSCVKEFEEHMHLAWSAASLVICRAGASTIAEQIAFEVPGILIPYPHAADDHQSVNAQMMAEKVKGAVHFQGQGGDTHSFVSLLEKLTDPQEIQLKEMKKAMQVFKKSEHKIEFADLIVRYL